MRRDDHGIDHEMVERFRKAGHGAAKAGLEAALAVVSAKTGTQPVEAIDGGSEDDSGN